MNEETQKIKKVLIFTKGILIGKNKKSEKSKKRRNINGNLDIEV